MVKLFYKPPEQRDTTSKDAIHARFRDAIDYYLQQQSSRQYLVFYHENLEISDIVHHIFPEDHSVRLLFDEFGLDESKPAHWRALLSALADNYVEHRGAKFKFSNCSQYELASDIYDLHMSQFEGSKARYQALSDALRTMEPYRDRWGGEQAKSFVKRVERLVKAISESGVIDRSFLSNAAVRYRRPEPDPRFEYPDESAEP